MSINLTIDICIYLLSNARNLCGKHRSKQLHLVCSPNHCWKIRHVSLQRGLHPHKVRCKWTKSETHSCSKHYYSPSNHGLHIGILKLSTSAPKGLTKVSIRMSRIKSTLNSVSKAVFGSQNEMISRLAQFKPSSRILRKVSDSGWLKQESIKQAIRSLKKYSDKSTEKSPVPEGRNHIIDKEDDIGKQSLFHYTGNITTKFGESFYFLSNHINSYFKRAEKMSQDKENSHFQEKSELEGKKVEEGKSSSLDPGILTSQADKPDPKSSAGTMDKATSPSGTPESLPISTKQSIANFLSRPTEGVQALVGGYIGGLVPKLKYDSKSQAEEQEEPAKSEPAGSKDKTVEEKKHLSLQREKIIARVSIDNRTRALVQALRRTADPKLCITRVEELTFHLLEFPEGKGVAVKERLIPCLLRLRQMKDETLQAAVREILALIGYVDPVKGRGIRILTIDGGGTRGVVALQTLRKLVELTQKPVHQLFDYICGVSTGAILAFMLGLFHLPLDECEELYRKLGSDIFSQNVIVGTVKMSWSHAFYDSQTWEKILKERMGSALMIETARNPMCPKVAAVSTIVNRGSTPKAFVFRNYGHFPGSQSHYLGGCQYKMWQAIRASSAAPGYFAEYALGNDLHQDGGLLLNNPSALAMHECKCLWPDAPLECIVSLGTGRYESDVRNNTTYTSLKTKLSNVINSATDTEEVHIMLDGLLPPDTYFRFNPVMCENIPLDESRNEKLDQLQLEGSKYIERNEHKMKKVAKILSQEKTTLQKINDWIKLKTDMYEGLPFFSKL
ncbi:calcium-independent phospholipase A2-gamma [Oryctolagus cuniculus]|uniref:Calcium-independent phospholipase A2-gamma n=1 Tax=Oryctolagus cuniculus TaxID=9986 RepID=PLPL8_RABIT|nr:calcium-independent phospholipase A2-gamma [Oryctolagus cuniculus]Q5XTS1.1 RecName: Full=Calcium-independent phospholipase A2-gamma; AltName: Full=Group VIB calcium-independent phospholipase A2; AltName: Full=Intracellular membrane-associated calcium-independent phospholipase A2 gamma; Short=iPLA2-gamma; AltName: Full=Patatin-like phospholipase domain-containing protein 8 [Oryctolagus cuniculus]AAU85256.1 group VIB calcium-independent phospholipase A2 [Oryctolagus cuniculus]